MKTRTEVIAELKGIVQTERHVWADTAFARAISAALTAFNKDRPLVSTSAFELRAGKGSYAADDCMIRYLGSYWGMEQAFNQWDAGYPGATPRIHSMRRAGGMVLEFSPAPNWKHIAAYGQYFEYQYAVGHVLSDEDCSIHDDDYDLFLTRALAALMRDLIAANVTEPIQLHRGMGSTPTPTASTPLAAYAALMEAYREGVA